MSRVRFQLYLWGSPWEPPEEDLQENVHGGLDCGVCGDGPSLALGGMGCSECGGWMGALSMTQECMEA